jgi:hypothetical protein
VSFNGLANIPLSGIQLNCTLDFECSGVGSVASNSHKNQTFFVGGGAVVDYLRASERYVTIKNLLRRRSRVGYSPVIDCSLGDESNGGIGKPLPKYDIFVIYV